jgi:starch-binding outer membrane protein, SusD/RagB family
MKLKKILFTAAVALSCTSCGKKYLELTNPNAQTTGTFWKTESDAVMAVNAVYQSLYYDGTFLRFAQCALDFRGDDMMSPSPWDVLSNTGSFKLFNNAIMQQWLWIAFYGGVSRANFVLDNINKVPFKDQTLYNRLKGEALFLRGLNYYYLVTFFNKIPLVTKFYEKSEEYFPAQAPTQDVWNQIYQDLDEASKLLPVSYSGNDLGRATKGAALAFLGKSYLFNQKHDLAMAKFKEVMNLGVYDLVSNYGDNFTEANENNKESIFEIQFSREVGGTTLGWVSSPASDWSKTTARAITFGPAPFGWNDAAPTRWIVDEFLKEKTTSGQDDPRLRATIYYNYPGCTLYGQSFQTVYAADLNKLGVKKYGNGDSNRPDEKDWRSGINERLMRYADVLLMYAECANEQGNTAECAKYIQQVRNRAGLPNREAEFAALSKEQMRDRIAHERALEFALEGHRFDDIRRWGWLQNPTKLAELKTHDPEFNSYVAGREYFSIPQAEIDVNKKLRQNDGY